MLICSLIEIKTSRRLVRDYYKIDGADPVKPDDDSEDVEAV